MLPCCATQGIRRESKVTLSVTTRLLMKEQPVTFRSGSLALKGLIAKPEGAAPTRAGVVCHPHPLYGGSMYNNVVDAALEAMWSLGWASLRFNFRGVGESEGEHSGGAGR